MLKSKKFWYISLFAILYLIVAFSSFFHACSFFGLANNTWMSIILAFAFEVGQAAVLFSLLTSTKDRSRIMPWVLMTMFTFVQVIGNVFSSYKYIITNSSNDLRYFKEPIFIWTDLPDEQATVIIVYLVGALLPIAALLLTSMITNYLTDINEEKKDLQEIKEEPEVKEEPMISIKEEPEVKEEPKVKEEPEVKEEPKLEIKEEPKIDIKEESEIKEEPKIEIKEESEIKEEPKIEIKEEPEVKEEPKIKEEPKHVYRKIDNTPKEINRPSHFINLS